jgi:N6-L-threonylcarbamoyladenine synthase
MRDHGSYRRLGRTRDDAAGEAFDKVGRLLGLGFPGGPAIERTARAALKKPALRLPRAWLKGSDDFSFSGLKTAVLHVVRGESGEPPPVPEIAAAFQASVVDVLSKKASAALREACAASCSPAASPRTDRCARRSSNARRCRCCAAARPLHLTTAP